MLLLLLWSRFAGAAVPISLPPDETIGHWQAAFELADLRHAQTRAEASVVIRVTGASWQIVARAPDGRERSETVARPSTPVEREEVALLAMGLVRDLGIAETPSQRPHFVSTPPPPPPRPIPAPPPKPVPPKPVLEPPKPSPVLKTLPPLPIEDLSVNAPKWEEPDEVVRTFPPTPPALGIEPDPFADLDTRPPPTRAVATPGFSIGPVVFVRSKVVPTAGLDLSVTPIRLGRWYVDLEFQIFIPARLQLGTITERSMLYGSARATAAYRITSILDLRIGAGASVLDFRQQFFPIDTLWTPVASAGLSIDVLTWRKLTLTTKLYGTADLNAITLIDETGQPSVLSPVTGFFSIVLKTSTLGDPSATLPTSRR